MGAPRSALQRGRVGNHAHTKTQRKLNNTEISEKTRLTERLPKRDIMPKITALSENRTKSPAGVVAEHSKTKTTERKIIRR